MLGIIARSAFFMLLLLSYSVKAADFVPISVGNITVFIPVNQAKGDSFTLPEDTHVELDILANDMGLTTTVVPTLCAESPYRSCILFSESKPFNNIYSVENGKLRFQAPANWHGQAELTYQFFDEHGYGSNKALVALVVEPVNDAPVARADSVIVSLGGKCTSVGGDGCKVLIDVLNNDTDVEGGSLTVHQVTGNESIAKISLDHNRVVYKPKSAFFNNQSADLNLVDTFTYSVKDAQGNVSANVDVQVYLNSSQAKAPTISQVEDIAQVEGEPNPKFIVTVNDEDTPGNLLKVTAESTNPSILPSSDISIRPGANVNQRIVELQSTSGVAGRSLVTLTVTDNSGLSSTNGGNKGGFSLFREQVNSDSTSGLTATESFNFDKYLGGTIVDVRLESETNQVMSALGINQRGRLKFTVLGKLAANDTIEARSSNSAVLASPLPIRSEGEVAGSPQSFYYVDLLPLNNATGTTDIALTLTQNINNSQTGLVGTTTSRVSYPLKVLLKPMEVVKYHWEPQVISVGQPATLHWDIENAVRCETETAGLGAPRDRAKSGTSGPWIYFEAGVHTSQWHCYDTLNNRIPAEPHLYLETTRTMEPMAAPANLRRQGYGDAATLVWDPVPYANRYDVLRKVGNQWQAEGSAIQKQTTFSLAGLGEGLHEFKVGSCIYDYHKRKDVCGEGIGTYNQVTIDTRLSEPEVKHPSAAAAIPGTINEVLQSTRVGVLQGQFRVDESGSATYSIPINTPVGIGNISPELALTYNSSAGNGPLGMGWSLSGLSAITRCRQTTEQDGDVKAIDLSANDRFCLNGQKLIAVEGNYGESGTKYRTELDSQSLVISKGVMGQGPEYFEVRNLDGSVHTYGKNTDSQLKTQSGDVLVWNLNKIQDNMQNAINFKYSHGQYGANEILISEISYSGHAIVFDYSSAADTKRKDIRSGYMHGVMVEQSARLDKVRVKYQEGAEQVYFLDYANEAVTHVTQLQQVELCDKARTVCLQPIKFDWQQLSNNKAYTYANGFTDDDFILDLLPADIDANGISDIVYVTTDGHNSYKLKAKYNWGNGYSPTREIHSFTSTEAVEAKAVDIDGDGKVEVVFNQHKSLKYFDFNNSITRQVTTNNCYNKYVVEECNETINIENRVYDLALSTETAGKLSDAYFADINGDAKVDWLHSKSVGKQSFAINQGVNDNGYVRFGTFAEIDITFPTDIPKKIPTADHGLGGYVFERDFGFNVKNLLSDFNNDGRADLLVGYGYKYKSTESPDSGDCSPQDGDVDDCRYEQLEDGFVLAYVFNGTGFDYYGLAAEIRGQVSANNPPSRSWAETNVTVGDLNNDGYTDVLNGWTVRYGTGLGLTDSVALTVDSDSNYNFIQRASILDMNGDGRSDIVVRNGSTWYAYYQTEGSFTDKQALYTMAYSSYPYEQGKDSAFLGEWEGDGTTDFAWFDSDKKRLRIYTDRNNDGRPANMIEQITSGFDVKTVINYERLNNSRRYVRGLDAETLQMGRCHYDSRNGSQCSPVYDLTSPSYIVSIVTSDAPGYDSNGNYDAHNRLSVEYQYFASRAQAGGRGLLGFEKISTYDRERDVTTETLYHQDFPYIGMPKATLSYFGEPKAGALLADGSTNLEENQRLKYALNSYQYNLLKGNSIYQPYLYNSTEYQYSPSATSKQTTKLGSTVTTNTYEIKQDNHAVLTGVTVVNKNDSGDIVKTISTTNQYEQENIENWWLNRVTKTTVKHSRSGSDVAGLNSVTRVSAFGYNSGTGMLEQEVLEPEGADDEKLTTLHCYDSVGNKVSTTTYSNLTQAPGCNSAQGFVPTLSKATDVYRQQATKYDPSLRHVSTTGNAKFTLNTINSRNQFGQVTQSTNIDGVTTKVWYDTFGQQYASANNLGQRTQVERRLFAQMNEILAPAVDAEAVVYVERTTSAGKPVTWAYYDVMGRQVASVKEHFANNKYVFQYNKYDQWGQVVAQSVPSTSKVASHWTTTDYDDFGRVNQSTAADGTVTSAIYEGLTTRTTIAVKLSDGNNGKFLTQSESKNVLGETVEVVDANQQALNYKYDATGNLTEVKGVDGAIVSTTFDSLGRKKGMDDPDKGKWFYQYNALGELIEQTDARKYKTETVRDAVGRTIKRRVLNSAGGVEDVTLYEYKTSHRLQAECLVSGNENSCSQASVAKFFVYDKYGRIQTLMTNVDNQPYNETTVYDEYGRVFQQFDAMGDFFGIQNNYNSKGYLLSQEEARYGGSTDAQEVYYQVESMDAFGNVTQFKQNNQKLTTDRAYDPKTGLLKQITATNNSLTQTIQESDFVFDGVGNLTQRTRGKLLDKYEVDGKAVNRQKFEYDNLHRLTSINGSQRVAYAANGNISWKYIDGVKKYYCYGQSGSDAGPHALLGIRDTDSCTGVKDYIYDANGNMTVGMTAKGHSRRITYSHFDKPVTIDAQGVTNFGYDSARKRYKRQTVTNEQGQNVTTTTYYIGNVEVISKSNSGIVQTRRYLPGAIRTHGGNGSDEIRYLHKDHLGSIDSITDEKGKLVEKLYFDPWGKKHSIPKDMWDVNSNVKADQINVLNLTSRGFTGHEHVDHADIIHMNGRIYDPSLGRFLQADPFIQAPMNSQSYNRYAYVLNNPLSYTDPSGYFFKSLFKFVKKYWRTIAAVAASYVTFGLATGAWSFAAIGNLSAGALIGGGAAAGFVSGAISTGSLKGALQGAFSGAVFGAIGGAGLGGFEKFALSGIAGGIMQEMQGGKFGHGFMSAGVTSVAGGAFGKTPMGRVIGSFVVGGTVSKLTGGKFANGALTAAFAAALRSDWSNKKARALNVVYKSKAKSFGESVKERKEAAPYIKKINQSIGKLRMKLEAAGDDYGLKRLNETEFEFINENRESESGIQTGEAFYEKNRIEIYRHSIDSLEFTVFHEFRHMYSENYMMMNNAEMISKPHWERSWEIDADNWARGHLYGN